MKAGEDAMNKLVPGRVGVLSEESGGSFAQLQCGLTPDVAQRKRWNLDGSLNVLKYS